MGPKKDFVNRAYDSVAIAGLTMQKSFAEKWRALDPQASASIKVLSCIEDAFEYVRMELNDGGERTDGKDGRKEVHALITGSVHLVGRALGVLEGVDAL